MGSHREAPSRALYPELGTNLQPRWENGGHFLGEGADLGFGTGSSGWVQTETRLNFRDNVQAWGPLRCEDQGYHLPTVSQPLSWFVVSCFFHCKKTNIFILDSELKCSFLLSAYSKTHSDIFCKFMSCMEGPGLIDLILFLAEQGLLT